MKILRILSKSVAASAMVLASAQIGLAADTIKIGVIFPVSGAFASVGLGTLDGVKMAVEEINAAGGINGLQLTVIERDSQLKPDVASAAARELISKEGVKLFIGPSTSGTSLAVSEIAKLEKVVQIIPSAKTEALTAEKLHKYVFQLSATTDVDGKRYASTLEKIGAKKVCLTGYDYAYTTDFHRGIRDNLSKDIEITNEYLVKLGTTDYGTLVSQLMADPCDTILGSVWGGGFIAMVKQGNAFGLFKNKKLVWGADMGQYEMAEALKADFPEGMWATTRDLWYINDSDAMKEFHAKLAKVQGKEATTMYPVTGYNSVMFLKAAIIKAGSTDPDAVAEALEGLTIDTPLGKLTIDAKTHRANTPEYYGQLVTVPGSDIKRMTNITLEK